MELFEALGINGKLLVAQIINFLILIYLLKRFAYAPIISMLEQRKAKITEGLENAEKAKTELDNAEKNADEIREQAYAEAKKLIADAKVQADTSAKELIEKANKQADRIIKAAEESANQAKDKALAEARKHISNIVVLALEKIVGGELNKEQRDKLTSKAIEEL